jgi:hypothetical protein
VRGSATRIAVCVAVAGCHFAGNLPADEVDAGGLLPRVDAGPIPDAPPGSPDAAPAPDAGPTFTCPQDYTLFKGSSAYRIAPAQATWQAAEEDCENDTGGMWSHLVVIDDSGEWSSVNTTMALTHGGDWWSIGIVRDAENPGGPWRKVNGGNATFLQWRQTLGADEPNNGGNGEPVVAIDPGFNITHDPTSGGFLDVSVDGMFWYGCECDGLPPVNAEP